MVTPTLLFSKKPPSKKTKSFIILLSQPSLTSLIRGVKMDIKLK
jgi:hypothetical protein